MCHERVLYADLEFEQSEHKDADNEEKDYPNVENQMSQHYNIDGREAQHSDTRYEKSDCSVVYSRSWTVEISQ